MCPTATSSLDDPAGRRGDQRHQTERPDPTENHDLKTPT